MTSIGSKDGGQAPGERKGDSVSAERNGDSVSAKAVKCYREEHVSGLSQKELILMLYDGAIKSVVDAKAFIDNKDYAQSYKSLVKGRNIVTELLRILNIEQGGEVAKNLQRLYLYVIGRLTEVNFTKETRLLDNAVDILNNLRSAWAEIDFEKAVADMGASDSGENGNNGTVPKSKQIRQPADQSSLLSITA
jgi:flagellar protein FliS